MGVLLKWLDTVAAVGHYRVKVDFVAWLWLAWSHGKDLWLSPPSFLAFLFVCLGVCLFAFLCVCGAGGRVGGWVRLFVCLLV